jgi:hypothetical protein
MNDNKRCFVQWFAIMLSYAVATFFAAMYGLPQLIWSSDVTHMTSLIGIVFVVTCLYLGFASFRYNDAWPQVAEADSGLARIASYVVTLMGLLGTVIGLTLQVRAMAGIDASNPATIVGFIASFGSSLSTALYSTACGIVASIGITGMYANIDYFLDRRG